MLLFPWSKRLSIISQRLGICFVFLIQSQISTAQFAINAKGEKFSQPVDYQYKPLFLSLCDNSVFMEEVNFSEARFTGKTSFINTVFEKRVNFQKVTFYRSTSFENSKFLGLTDFGYIQPKKELYFRCSIFKEETRFWESSIKKTIDFTNATFQKDVVFISSKIHRAVFDSAKFMGDVSFDYAELESCISFQNTIFKGKVRLRETVLPDTLLLINTKLLLLDFDKCKPNANGECLLYLENIDISKLWIDFRMIQLMFLSKTALSFEEKKEVFKNLLEQEKKRKRMESYQALDEQFEVFLTESKD